MNAHRPRFTVDLTDDSFDIDVGTRHEWGFILLSWTDEDLDEDTAWNICQEILSDMVYFKGSQLTWDDDPDIEVVEIRR